MNILAVDTTTSICAVGVCRGERLLAETIVDCGRTHTERLVMTVDWVLSETSLSLDDLDALAVTVGPGSFTGLRVGVAAMKGLALGKRLPLVPVPTLDAMTRLGAFHDGCVCPVLDAKMGEVFGAVYRFAEGKRTKATEDLVVPVEQLLEHVEDTTTFLGDGTAVYGDRIRAGVRHARFAPSLCAVPRASAVALEAAALLEQGVSTNPSEVAPVYLRKSQAEQNRDQALAP